MSAAQPAAAPPVGGRDRARAPGPGPLRPFHFPGVQRRTLPNGLEVVVAEVRTFPVVTLDLILPAGALAEAPEHGGLAVLTAGLLESGAAGRSADEIAEIIDGLGLSLDAGASWDTTQVGFTCLRSRLAEGCAMLAELVRSPTFPRAEVDRLRDERLAALIQRRNDPGSIAGEILNRYVFAPEVAYARPIGGTTDTVAALGQAEVERFHATRYLPRGATLVAAGDVSADEVAELAGRWFGDWEGAPPPPATPEVRPRLAETTIILAHLPGAVQSELRVGHPGVPRITPDYFPLTVMNAVLGYTFSSRLNMNLRERLGYTYGASSSFTMRRTGGSFSVSAAVQTEGTAHAVAEVLREMRSMREGEVTPTELDDARSYLAGVFPIGLQTTDGMAGKLTTLVTYGLPDDYWDAYRERIVAVTAAQVREAARDRLMPERAVVVVVADAEQVRGPLGELGLPLVEVDPETELP